MRQKVLTLAEGKFINVVEIKHKSANSVFAAIIDVVVQKK